MKIARTYGNSPYQTFVIHGGPGAAGEMAPVAKELSSRIGVVEPFQGKKTISDLVLELKDVIEQYSDAPVYLIGYSWGAWLSFIFTASHPKLVKKLILVGSGPFEEQYANEIKETRLSRLSDEDKRLLHELEQKLNDSDSNMKNILLQYGNLMSKADSFAPFSSDQNEEIEVDLEIFQSVWKEASNLRSNGELIKFSQLVSCPVVVIHGDYDPHPYDGVIRPLLTTLKEFKYIVLENCGHTPWKERIAKGAFYRVLFEELQEN